MSQITMDGAGMEGCLMKRSDTLKQWRMRWFKLRPRSMHLEYRKAAADSTAHGIIPLRHVCVGPLPSPAKHREWFCFYIQGPTFTYWLAADSLGKASSWIDRISAEAKYATAAALAWASRTPSVAGTRSVYTSVDGRSSPRESNSGFSSHVEANVDWPPGKDQSPGAPFNLLSGFFPWSDEIGDHRTGSTEAASVREEDWEEKFTPIGSPSSAHFSTASVLRSTIPSSASSLARIEATQHAPSVRQRVMPTDMNSQAVHDSTSRWFEVGRWWRTASLSHMADGETTPSWAKQYEQMAGLLMDMRDLLEAKERQLEVLQQASAIDARQLAAANLRVEEIASKSREDLQALQNDFEAQSRRCKEEKDELVQRSETASANIEALRKQLEEEIENSAMLQSRVGEMETELAQQADRATQAESEYARLALVEERCTKLETEASELRKKLEGKEELLLRPFWGK